MSYHNSSEPVGASGCTATSFVGGAETCVQLPPMRANSIGAGRSESTHSSVSLAVGAAGPTHTSSAGGGGEAMTGVQAPFTRA